MPSPLVAASLLLVLSLVPATSRADEPATATATATAAPGAPPPLPTERAIERGAKALLRVLRRDRPPSEGESALVALALLRSGVAPGDADLAKTVLRLRRAAAHGDLEDAYDASLRILAVEALAHERVARADGGPPYYRSRPLAPEELSGIRGAADCLCKVGAAGAWSYGLKTSFGGPDPRVNESTTQFAVLGLDRAARAGVPVAAGLWASVRDYHVGALVLAPAAPVPLDLDLEAESTLERDPPGAARERPPEDASTRPRSRWAEQGLSIRPGRWHYERDSRTIPRWSRDPDDEWFDPEGLAMTLAGTSSLAIACGRAGGKESDEIGMGLAAAAVDLRAALERWRRHRPRRLNYYLLYSLEKTMDVLGVRRLGGIDWYREGAQLILSDQKEDGMFGDGGEVDTALALLFLNRATRTTPPPRVETGLGTRQTEAGH